MTTADLQPGPELDRLVAEKVMGWTLYHYDKDVAANCYYCLFDADGDAVVFSPRPGVYVTEFKTAEEAYARFAPSTNIAHAWEAAEKLKELGVLLLVFPHREAWAVGILEREPCHPDHFLDDSLNGIVYGKVPHAICLAALKAVQS
jgi:hypothetical protein